MKVRRLVIAERTRATPVASRLATGVLVLACAGLLATCRLGDLVNSPPPGTLAVTPPQLVDSAHAGSTAPRVLTVGVEGSGEALPWVARSVLGSAWLSLSATAGTLPDTLSLALDPTRLAVGVYRDTLVFSLDGPAAVPVTVPVEFRIV